MPATLLDQRIFVVEDFDEPLAGRKELKRVVALLVELAVVPAADQLVHRFRRGVVAQPAVGLLGAGLHQGGRERCPGG